MLLARGRLDRPGPASASSFGITDDPDDLPHLTDDPDDAGELKHDDERPTAGAELTLQIEEARDVLVHSREVSRRELLMAVLGSGAAGGAFGLEAWGVWRGEPVFGWLVFVVFAGFAAYFWSRRRKAEVAVASEEELLRQLEARRSVPAETHDRPAVPPPMP